MTSKSSYSGHRRSMFAPLRFPPFYSEKSTKSEGDAATRTPDPELHTPGSETSAGSSSAEVVVAETDNGQDGGGVDAGEQRLERGEETKLARPKSRIGLLAQYILPSLTPESADLLPPQRTTAALPDPDVGIVSPDLKAQRRHSRTPSIPNMLRKVRISSLDGGMAHGEDVPPVPALSTSMPPVPPVLSVAESQALRKTRDRTRSDSLESGRPQSRLQPHDGPSSPRIRSSSAQPPTVRKEPVNTARVASVPQNLGSPSKASSTGGSPHPEGRKLKKLFGRSRSNSRDVSKTGAWVIGPDSNVDYNTSSLTNGEKVSAALHHVRRGELICAGTGAVARKRRRLRLSGHEVQCLRSVLQDRVLLHQHISSVERHGPSRHGLSRLPA